MPKQYLPESEEFVEFEGELKLRGFRRISGHEFATQFLRLGLKAPRPRRGRELGYVFHANHYTVFVWTTWLQRERVARDEDAGWVLISDKDNVLYFSRPIHRTKNFLANLLMQARIACWRVRHRPLCPECHNFMHIVRGKALKQRFWQCDLKELHKDKKNRVKSWDHGLPTDALEYLKPIRKKRVKRYATLRAKGKEPHQAMLARKLWGTRKS